MSSSKHINKLCAAIIALGLVITLLFMNGERLGLEKIVDEDSESYEGTAYFSANDLNGNWSADKATAVISLSDGQTKVSGKGAYYNDGNVVITGTGYYVFSGSLSDGGIVVDAYDSSKVFIMLDGVDIYRSDDACLRVDKADKVFLTLAEGSENRMESGSEYSETALEDKTGGTIFSHDDLTINGSGRLDIVANYKHGIDANDDLKISGGEISVSAPVDGFHVNDSFCFAAADLSISSGDDAIHSDSDIYIESGSISISECYEGIEAPHIDIAGGDIAIYPTDDGINANGGSNGFGGFGGMGGNGGGFGGRGNHGNFDRQDGTADPGDSDSGESGERPGERPDFEGGDEESSESSGDSDSGDSDAESEESYIRISGGNILIVNENAQDADGLDSNGSIYITGGNILISLNGNGSNNAIDYGSENGGTAEISGGSIIACGGSAMAESFSESSAQASLAYNTNAAAGTAVALRNPSGNTLLSWEVPCSFSFMIMSCPAMSVGESYVLSVGDSEEEVTLESALTTLGESGGMGGFGGGFGGRGNRGGFGDLREGGEGDSLGERPERGDFDGESPQGGGSEGDFSDDRPQRGFGGRGNRGGFGQPGGDESEPPGADGAERGFERDPGALGAPEDNTDAPDAGLPT